MRNGKPRLCFVALTAWPVLSGDRAIKTVGGSEVQQGILVRAFVEAGYPVSMICMDYGQPEGVEIDGIRVHKAHTPDGGLPGLRFLHPRFTSLWTAMKRADADIYYQRACGAHTGYVAAFCRLYGRKFVYAAAHDEDFDPLRPTLPNRRDKAIYAWGLKRAHAIVVQNPVQQEQCREVYRRTPTLIRSCYTPPAAARMDPHGYVLWVSTMRKWKRPENFIALAEKLPQYRFRMVGGASDRGYFEDLLRQAEAVPNLEFMGFVPYADIEREFDGARLFVNTSQCEGFPNTFLQAWARGVPTVSFVDTGSWVSDHPVVNRIKTLDEMADAVQQLMTDDKAWRATGARCAACYARQHSVQVIVGQYEAVFEGLMVSNRERDTVTEKNERT